MRDSRTLKLLIVEDSLEDEQLLCEALLEIEENRLWCTWRSSSVVPVDRLADALDCLHRESFDAVLLNLTLPDSPSALDSFLDLSAHAGSTPILVMADEPDENLANRLLRQGAQDVLVKSELECIPLARSIRYAIERQLRVDAARAAAFMDDLTGVLTRDAFLNVARYRNAVDSLALLEVAADRDALDPLLMQAADTLRDAFQAPAVVGRWDRRRFCVLAPESTLDRFTARLPDSIQRCSVTNLEELLDGEYPLHAKTAILAD